MWTATRAFLAAAPSYAAAVLFVAGYLAHPANAQDAAERLEPASVAPDRFAFPSGAISLSSAEPIEEEPTSAPDESEPRDESDASKMSVSDIATKLSNPVGELWVITNQYNVTEFRGKPFNGSRWQNNLNIQPVLPLHLTDKWNLINRPIIPLYFYSPYPDLSFNPRAALPRLVTGGPLGLSRRLDRLSNGGVRNNVFGRGIGPGFRARRAARTAGALSAGIDVETDRACGIGDITLVSLLSPRKPPKIGNGSFVWGVGPTLIFPTASPDVLGQGQFQAGPAGVALYMDEKWVFGALAQQWWSYAEKGGGHPHTNQMSLQYFVWYQFLPGWQVGTSPIVTVDWTKSAGEGFTLPIGIGVQRTMRIGKLPIKLGFQYQYSVVHPNDDVGSRNLFQFTVSPVLPALVKGNLID